MDEKILDGIENLTIFDSLIKANSILQQSRKAMCSISGGSDSDIVLDIMTKVDDENKVEYVWFDTGLEYKATKEHIDYLEKKYNIKIRREKAIKPIPYSVRKYGVPFLSKHVSEMLERLQRHGFKWEDKPYEELAKEYPRCKSALKWWCNTKNDSQRKFSRFSIDYNKWLKEFIMQNPPDFPIAAKCCTYAKKNLSDKIMKEMGADMSIVGVRKAEGGVRAGAYKTCFTQETKKGGSAFRPIFWYRDVDKLEYEKSFGITHSRCYTEYGLIRTGCVGCPFNRNITDELHIIKEHEPNLYKAAMKIFGKSYEYTYKYREFVRMKNEEEKYGGGQLSFFGELVSL